MVLRDYKAFIKGLSSNSKVSKHGTKTKQLVAITIALTLTLSILLMMPTINTTNNNTTIIIINNNNNDITKTMSIRGDKLPQWKNTTGHSVRSVDISPEGNFTIVGLKAEFIPYKIIAKSGKTKIINIFARSIKLKGKDAFLAALIDVTENREAELKLKESEEKFRSIADQSQMGIMIFQDMDTKYINGFLHLELLCWWGM